MPVILQPRITTVGLDGETEDVCALAVAFPSQLMSLGAPNAKTSALGR